jgi:hypothetical protein
VDGDPALEQSPIPERTVQGFLATKVSRRSSKDVLITEYGHFLTQVSSVANVKHNFLATAPAA